MHRLRHNLLPLILGIFGFVSLGVFTNRFAPNALTIIAIFLIIFLISSLLIIQVFLNNVRRSVLISLGLTIFLALRATDLRDPLYTILLLACLISLELLFRKR